jgi:hypothetical protein
MEKTSIIMIDREIYSSVRTALLFCSLLTVNRTVLSLDDFAQRWTRVAPRERRAFEEFIDGNPDLVAEELEPYFEKGKIFLVTRETRVRGDQISSRTSRPTRAHGG